jgi:hypothetical protein
MLDKWFARFLTGYRGVMEADLEERRTSSSGVKLRATPRFTSSAKAISSFPKTRRCFPPWRKAPGATLTQITQWRWSLPSSAMVHDSGE